MTDHSSQPVSLSVHPELAAIARTKEIDPDTDVARKDALRLSIEKSGVTRPIHVWASGEDRYVLDGVEIFKAATSLGLIAGKDFEVIDVPLPDLLAAKKWRYERAVSMQKTVPLFSKCRQAVELFREDAKDWKRRAKANQRTGGSGVRVDPKDKVDTIAFFAGKAQVSRATMSRAMVVLRELRRHDDAPSPRARPVLPAAVVDAVIAAVERDETSMKGAAEDIKNERGRELRKDLNSKGAPAASTSFTCDRDYDASKRSQIIQGDSLALLSEWAERPASDRPQPSLIFGSPPYWIPDRKDPQSGGGKGRINYGSHFSAMMEERGIVTWEGYVEKFLRPCIASSYALLPRGGRLVLQVDNTRGRNAQGDLEPFFHTDEIRRLAKQYGFIPSSEIIWQKSEISGRKQGFGSMNSPTIRPNHEYIVVLRKDCNKIEGDFDCARSEMNELAISSWDAKSLDELTEFEKVLYTADCWKIGAARSKVHAAPFPSELARRVIRLFAPIGTVVLDPFHGTGTTGAMATLTGRRFIGIDIEPYNCEIAAEKIAAAAKELPRLEALAESIAQRRVA